MGRAQRVKGASGERELAAILSDWLGVTVKRNLGQAGCGVPDCKSKVYGYGVCSKHYQMAMRRKRGAPVRVLDVKQRIDDRSEKIPEAGCWLWTGTLNHRGYGMASYNDKTIPAHRLAYQTFVGPIPEGQSVLHRCDIRCCVNPAHLFLGTHADNMADMKAKGRSRKGAANAHAKLTDDSVRLIRAAKEPSWKLAIELGVSVSAVKQARAGLTWGHVA